MEAYARVIASLVVILVFLVAAWSMSGPGKQDWTSSLPEDTRAGRRCADCHGIGRCPKCSGTGQSL